MRIAGLVTCVDYAGHLCRSIGRWRDELDRVLVVTAERDEETRAVCSEAGVPCLVTDAWTRDGAIFNKSAALDEGLAAVAPDDWCLLFDADVQPPIGWRTTVEQVIAEDGGAPMLYGARRVEESGERIADGELAGFFQLWHASDPHAQARPLLGSWLTAGGYDTAFADRWPAESRRIIDLPLVHRGPRGRNWCGVGKDKDLLALRMERHRRRGWRHERIDVGGQPRERQET